MDIQQGEAVFLPPEPCLWELLQAAKRAIRDGKEARRFIVVREEMYYPGMLDQLLGTPGRLRKEARLYDEAIAGEEDGCLRCALLWENNREGLLLHGDGSALLCAYVPAVTKELANREREWARKLAVLAGQAADTPVVLDRGIEPGKHALGKLLRDLSEQMDCAHGGR